MPGRDIIEHRFVLNCLKYYEIEYVKTKFAKLALFLPERIAYLHNVVIHFSIDNDTGKMKVLEVRESDLKSVEVCFSINECFVELQYTVGELFSQFQFADLKFECVVRS